MVHSQHAFGKSFGVKTEKSYLFKFLKNAFFGQTFSPQSKDEWLVTFLVSVVSCDPYQDSKQKKCFENDDR